MFQPKYYTLPIAWHYIARLPNWLPNGPIPMLSIGHKRAWLIRLWLN